MAGCRVNLLLAAIAGLILALAPTPARALLVLGDASPLLGVDASDVQALAGELLGSVVEDQGMSLASPSTPGSNPDGDDPDAPQYKNGIVPTGGCQSNTVSQSNGPGSSTGAIAGTVHDLPDPPLQTPLAREGRPILPTGPPFELLRPPEADC